MPYSGTGHTAVVKRVDECHTGIIADPVPTRCFPAFDLLYAPIDGPAFLEFDGECFEIPVYDMVVVAAGTPHKATARGGFARIGFNSSALGIEILELSRQCPALYRFLRRPAGSGDMPILHASFAGDLMAFNNIVRLVKEHRRHDQGTQAAMDCLLEYAIISLIRNYSIDVEVSQAMRDHPKVTGMCCASDEMLPVVLEYIHDHCADATLRSTAECFGYHPNSISMMLKRETGRSYSDIVRGCRMEMASDLLMRTDLPVEAIARRCGYQHMGSFYKTFRNHFGTTPHSLREAS